MMDQKAFTVYPAIDLLGRRAVRLRQGRREDVTDCGDPVKLAAKWREMGAKWLHVVDLEAAFDGQSGQGDLIKEMVDAFHGPVQLGGGIRSMPELCQRLDRWGVSRVILGTVAITNPELVQNACLAYPGKIASGIDAKDGMVAVRGWVDISAISAAELAMRMEDAGVAAIIYTDISRDGMMTGPNVEASKQLVDSISVPVIASGGVASLNDLRAAKLAGCAGVITGKALYSGAFTLDQALLAEREE